MFSRVVLTKFINYIMQIREMLIHGYMDFPQTFMAKNSGKLCFLFKPDMNYRESMKKEKKVNLWVYC